MAEPLSSEPYKGVRDFYPADWARLSAAFDIIRATLQGFGYEEYQASPLERAELYESKGNEEIIRDQSYLFEDRGGRRVMLRPEMTPTLARMVAAKRRELVFPLRWFSIGNRFRYERTQRGRLREFFQADIDFIGLPEGEADVEIVTIASEVLRAFGASTDDFVVRVNSRALLNAACKAAGLESGEATREYWRLVDKREKMSAEEFETERRKFSADPLAVIENGSDETVNAEKKRVEGFVETLTERGVVNAVFDMNIVRGFDYYTGIVFEINDTNSENPRALFGGGRYDGLVALFGGEPIPAVGFAMGDVTLMDFLETHNLLPNTTNAPQVYVGTPSPEDIPAAETFAATLRAQKLRVFTNLTDKALGDQVRDAVRRGIPYFIAYGAQEAGGQRVRVKTLAESAEEEVAVDDLGSFIRKEA